MMRSLSVLALVLSSAFILPPALAREAGPGGGRGPGAGGRMGGHDASARSLFGRSLFPPEMLMRHAEELGIEGEQREAIIREVQELQSSLVPLQWEAREQAEKLQSLLEASKVDEEAALAQAERVMQLESQVKRTHLAALIRIKNALTDEQREKLGELRQRMRSRQKGRLGGTRPGERR